MAKGRKPKSLKAKAVAGNPGKRQKDKMQTVASKGHPVTRKTQTPSKPKSVKVAAKKVAEIDSLDGAEIAGLDVPKWLNKTGKYAFRDLTHELSGCGLKLTKVNKYALGLLCGAWEEYRRANEEIQLKGEIYETETQSGAIMYRARPEVAIRSDAWKRFKSMAVEFGMTPASAAGLLENGEGEEDPLTKLVNMRAENRKKYQA